MISWFCDISCAPFSSRFDSMRFFYGATSWVYIKNSANLQELQCNINHGIAALSLETVKKAMITMKKRVLVSQCYRDSHLNKIIKTKIQYYHKNVLLNKTSFNSIALLVLHQLTNWKVQLILVHPVYVWGLKYSNQVFGLFFRVLRAVYR